MHQVDTIDVQLPVYNLSVDSEGSIWAAGFPKVTELWKAASAGDVSPPVSATVLRIKMGEAGTGDKGWRQKYMVEKVLEDVDAKVLGMTTIAVHDVATG